ncbi:hypothetical protein, partial [Edaphobacter sp. HDX4]|uniref:hypothetical protein n=1 Tax=Edaphobacter sp. HDX4 TaxID=2794064 RepID=UPI002FE637AB
RSAEGQEWSPQGKRPILFRSGGVARVAHLMPPHRTADIRAKPLPSPVKPPNPRRTISKSLSTTIQITSGTEINRRKVRIVMPRFSTIEAGQQKEAPAPAGAFLLIYQITSFEYFASAQVDFIGLSPVWQPDCARSPDLNYLF